MKRAFKYRFHPTDEQAAQLLRTFGCVRKVYNLALAERDRVWRDEQRGLRYGDTSALLTRWKQADEYAYLREVSCVPLQQALRHQQAAFAGFFAKRSKYPRFNRRRDLLHRLTTRLVRDNQTIVIEDLAVRNMVRNHSLARAISDASWAEFRSLLEYKCQWYGRELVVVDRWLPSSKLCSACGTAKAHLALNERTFRCDNPACGLVLDRDVNAARNILAAGLAVTVCGDGGRPQRNSPGGQRSTKRKTQPVMAGTLGLAGPGQGQTANSWKAMVFSTW
ncbi:transposase, IS605 OrfB family, central region [Streptomyces sp. TLI_105]|nr:transposase, IS605 OrfB family, central region [Streptomyces sp. TLI_105]